LALLLSRGRAAGRGRSQAGWLQSLGLQGVGAGLLGRLGLGRFASRWSPRPAESRGAGGGLVVLAVLLLGFTAGFLTAGAMGPQRAPDASSPLKVGPIGEIDTKVLSSEALLVAAYEGLPADEAKARARKLVEHLSSQGFSTARAYEFRKDAQSLWNVVIYAKGPSEIASLRRRLQALPGELPDEFAARLRQTPPWEDGNPWPFRISIQ
jgi:hypothetical protein